MRFGVEEEFFVVDPVSRNAVPQADPIVAAAVKPLGTRVANEDIKLQVECRTRPSTTAAELAARVRDCRRWATASAASHDLAVVATGTPVLGGAVPPPFRGSERHAQSSAAFRGLLDEFAYCALHVHVELPDRERAVLLSNHLRPYLPVLLALTANSPYWCERDTGYASWRTLLWSRWPVAGAPPYFRSEAHYRELVEMYGEAGALIDERTVFWDIRPSTRHPTLEIRVADVPITEGESVAYAALVRALAESLLPLVEAGDPGPPLEEGRLRLAYWRAARDGLGDSAVDVRTGKVVPIADLVRGLVDAARPALEKHGELDLVARWLNGLGEAGDGATRQRRAAGDGGLRGAVDYLVRETEGGAIS